MGRGRKRVCAWLQLVQYSCGMERERERCPVYSWNESLDLREETGWKWTPGDLSHRPPEAMGKSEISVGVRPGAPVFLNIYQ